MKKGDYYKWKAGKLKTYKLPWVIKHYKVIIDEQQYDTGRIVTDRAILIVGSMLFVAGFILSYLIFG